MASVPPALAPDSWVYNQNVGNFNPGTKAGQAVFKRNTKGLKEKNCLTETDRNAQAISHLLENKAPALGKVVTRISITYDAFGDPTEWGNLLCKYDSISKNILQRESHKSFINPVAIVDPLPAVPFTVTTLDPDNVNADK